MRSRLYGDRKESVLKEPGDIIIPLADGDITPDHIVGEVGDVLIGRVAGRRDDSEITLFKSLGLAIEDLASAAHVYAEAVRDEHRRARRPGRRTSCGALTAAPNVTHRRTND